MTQPPGTTTQSTPTFIEKRCCGLERYRMCETCSTTIYNAEAGFCINRDAREVRRVELPEEVAADQREHDRYTTAAQIKDQLDKVKSL